MKKYIFLFVFSVAIFFFWHDDASAAIGFNAMTSSTAHAAAMTFAHTVAGDNTILFYLENGHATMPLTGVTWNGDAMTGIFASTTAGVITKIWYIINPDSGTHNIVATSANADHWHDGVAVSYTGVDQTSPIDATSTGKYAAATTSYSAGITTIASNSWAIMAINSNAGLKFTGIGNTVERGRAALANPIHGFDAGAALVSGFNILGATCSSQNVNQAILLSFAPAAEPPATTIQYNQIYYSE